LADAGPAQHGRLDHRNATLNNLAPDLMKITLAENFRAIFYAPFYALKALNLAADEGVDIEWLAPGAPGGAIDDVKRGAIDLTWGGPMRVMKDHDGTPADGASLLCFGEVVSRDPFCLVGKPDPAGFELAALARLRLGVVSEVPTPWLCLQADLQDAGVDIAAMKSGDRVNTGLSMAQQLQALQLDELDAVQFFEPYVSEALAAHNGTLLYAACTRGPTVYTTFICSRDGLARHRDAFAALTRALQKLQDWIAAQGPAELARVTAPFFPEVPAALFLASIERYCRDGVWARHAEVSRSGFARLSHSLNLGGFIASPMVYESCVHNFDAPARFDQPAQVGGGG
jgi:NitT/TauT family transport system substrate-binding protein